MSKNILIEDIERISKQSHKSLYGKTSINLDEDNHKIPTDKCNNQSIETLKQNSIKDNIRINNAIKIMKAQLNYDNIFLFRQEASILAGIIGGATITNAENEAVRLGLIRKHYLPRARTKICLWEITEYGYEIINHNPKKWKSKGDYKHKFCSYRIGESYAKQGYKFKNLSLLL